MFNFNEDTFTAIIILALPNLFFMGLLACAFNKRLNEIEKNILKEWK